MPVLHFDDDARRNAETLIELAIAEDLGLPSPHLAYDPQLQRVRLDFAEGSRQSGDLTTSLTIPSGSRGSAQFVARKSGRISGIPVVRLLAERLGLDSIRALVEEGDLVGPGTALALATGPFHALLTFERTALNFLQRLSGVATLTGRFVESVKGTKAVILDTRKTTPGWRALEKYAVRCGGGRNHRIGLYDAILIKDNHLAWLAQLGADDPIRVAVRVARDRSAPGTLLEVEVDSLEQLDRALACRPDIVLVDNLGASDLAEAVRRRDAVAPAVLLEASGGVTLETAPGLANVGVDRISVGALTHSAPSLDIGLDYVEAPLP